MLTGIESNMAIGNWQCFIGHGFEGVPSNRRHDHEHCIGRHKWTNSTAGIYGEINMLHIHLDRIIDY